MQTTTAENQRRRQFEAAKHMTSGATAAPAFLANPAEEINQNKFNQALQSKLFFLSTKVKLMIDCKTKRKSFFNES